MWNQTCQCDCNTFHLPCLTTGDNHLVDIQKGLETTKQCQLELANIWFMLQLASVWVVQLSESILRLVFARDINCDARCCWILIHPSIRCCSCHAHKIHLDINIWIYIDQCFPPLSSSSDIIALEFGQQLNGNKRWNPQPLFSLQNLKGLILDEDDVASY